MERLIGSSMNLGTSVTTNGGAISSPMFTETGKQKNWNGCTRLMPIGPGGYAESKERK